MITIENKSKENINNVNKKGNFHITTYGCQMNEEDSEKLSGMLSCLGYEETKTKELADIIILNTCSIRENADNKAIGHIGELKKIKKEKPNTIICITGCFAQQKGNADKIITKFPFIDIIFGTHNLHKFPEYLNSAMKKSIKIKEIFSKEGEIKEGIPIKRKGSIKAYVTCMYGCSNYCTYCVVPSVRGSERSREMLDIFNEVLDLVSKGYKEIMLLGQNVNSYGKGLSEWTNFSNLLRKLNTIEGLERIRFMTSHPKDLNNDVIAAIKDCDKVCEQIHLPVQSGSSRILKAMNRHYTREKYFEIIKNIKDQIPDIGITTDLIVGFPGETEQDVADTIDLINKVKYDSAFTYIFSKRNNTPASKMQDQIPEDIKHQRFDKVLKAINKNAKEGNSLYLNKKVEILVEGFSENNKQILTGRTRSGKLVNFRADKSTIGTLIEVKIIETKSFSLLGEIISTNIAKEIYSINS